MSNCDDLLRQIAELKQRQARQQADLDQTERVSRALSNEQTGDPATQMLRRFLGAMDSDSIRKLVRRSLGERETPMGADGRFQNFAQLADWFDELPAEEMGAAAEVLLGDWASKAPGDHAFVTSTVSPEQFADMASEAFPAAGLDYDALAQFAAQNMLPVQNILEATTRNRVIADLTMQNMLADIRSIRAFMEESGVPAPVELGRKFATSYEKALLGQRNWALNRRRLGQSLQSLKKSPGDFAEQLKIPEQDLIVRPGTEGNPIPTKQEIADYSDDSIFGKVVSLVDQGPDGVAGLKQLELDIQIAGMDPLGMLDEKWTSPAARRDMGYVKDTWLFNGFTPIFSSAIPNRVMEIYGLAKVAAENGPLMAPFGTKVFRTAWRDRLEGYQTAWEAYWTTQRAMRLGFRELYWERFLDGNTPFANDIDMHGRALTPEQELQQAREVLQKPINWDPRLWASADKNPLGDEGLIRDIRDKLHVAWKLTQKSLAEKIPGVTNFPVTPGFRMLSVDDNVVGARMFRFKLHNDLVMDAKRNGIQLGLVDAQTGVTDQARLKAYVDKQLEDAIYQEIPSEQNLIDFRRKNGITKDLASDEDLRAYMAQKGIPGTPVLANDMQQGAWDYAQRMRMQNDPEGWAGKAFEFQKAGQKASWILDSTAFPFPRVPTNSIAFLLDTAMGPLGAGFKTAKLLTQHLHGPSPTKAQIAQVESAWVLQAFLGASFLALDNPWGKLTGNGPQDPKQRREWLAAGNIPNTVFGIPIPLGQVPLLSTLMLWKDLHDAADAAGASHYDKATIASGIGQVMTGAIVRATPLQFLQQFMQVLQSNDESQWRRFFGWVASGQGNPVSGLVRTAERLGESGSRDFYRYPEITAADRDLMRNLPEEIRYTEDGLRNLLVTLQPALGRIAGVAYREKDHLGRDIHLSDGMRQEDHPVGMPGFYTGPVHRELDRQDLLDPPQPLLTGRLNGVPLAPEAQKEWNQYRYSTKGGNDYDLLNDLHGRSGEFNVKTIQAQVLKRDNGEKVTVKDQDMLETPLHNLVAQAIKGRTIYEAYNWLFRSAEYRALQADPATSSNREVKDRPPARRQQMPGPWVIREIATYYDLRATGQLQASETPWAKEWQGMAAQVYANSIPEANNEFRAITEILVPRGTR
jgi:hypothetical protein